MSRQEVPLSMPPGERLKPPPSIEVVCSRQTEDDLLENVNRWNKLLPALDVLPDGLHRSPMYKHDIHGRTVLSAS